jgi:serine/threonine protein kinase
LILEEPLCMTDSIWNTISSDAKMLLRRLLSKNPNTRISLKDALTHPWIADAKSSVDSYTMERVLSRLLTYTKPSEATERIQ